jgi:mannose/fructose/N-acetylgalactosamine-specific phosphotransferase system component IID
MLSLITASLLGFTILGALTYQYVEIDDNSEVSLSDIAEDYYPEDLKMVFMALSLVIPAVLPIRLISKFTGVFRPLAVAFSMLTLIGSIFGIFTISAILCQGAMMRWTLS